MTDATLTESKPDPAHHGGGSPPPPATRCGSLSAQEDRDDLRLRVAVQPGGCSGLIYQLYFDERVLDGDAIVDFDGVEVVVDKMSVPYLDGATIDFEDTIAEAGLHHRQPQRGRQLRLRRLLLLSRTTFDAELAGASIRGAILVSAGVFATEPASAFGVGWEPLK